MQKKIVEIIVPCYNEQECITLLYENVKETFTGIENYEFKILYVDDGSHDKTLENMKTLAQKHSNVYYVSLARNFGKESAIYVGLSESTGDYVVLMDADLQHPPKLILEMLQAIEEGYDCCGARRISRTGEPIIRSTFSRFFYRIVNRITAIQLQPGETDYRLMTRQVVQAITSLKERERFTKGIYSWIGFKTKWITYENVERVAGTTKWSFTGLMHYAGNGFIAFATTPLRGVAYLGLCITFCTTIYAIFVIYGAMNNPDSRTGYTSLLVAILLMGGIIITILGIIGEYLARIYMEVKGRPLYIVRESNIAIKNEAQGDKTNIG